MSLRWGFVGTGYYIGICSDFMNACNSLCKAGVQNRGTIMAAAPTSSFKEVQAKYNIKHLDDNIDKLAQDKDVDVVFIAQPYKNRTDVIKNLLKNDKHVVCYKSLGLNYKETEDLINLAKERSRFLMEAMPMKFAPAYMEFQNQIDSQKIGDVLHIEGYNALYYKEGQTSDQYSCIMWLGGEMIHIARLIFKVKPPNITAAKSNFYNIDYETTATLASSDHKLEAILHTTWKKDVSSKITVYGTKGHTTLLHPIEFPWQMIDVDGKTHNFPRSCSDTPYLDVRRAIFVNMAIEVTNCIKDNLLESPRMTHQQSLELMEIIDEIRKK